MVEIPSNFTDFLHWFKNTTETFWQKANDDNTGYKEDAYTPKWIGLTEEQIDSVEKKYSIEFSLEHRAFLCVLHTLNQKEKIETTELINGEEVTVIEEKSYFYNWLTEDELIKEYLDWPYKTILADVLDKTWLKSWGEKPSSAEEKKVVFTKWYNEAPKVLPLRAHTFLINDSTLDKRPVLSVYGADVIISGWSLQAYLISQFSDALGLTEMVYNEEDKVYYNEFKKKVPTTYTEYFKFKLYYPIPYWEEMVLYYNWQFHKVDESK